MPTHTHTYTQTHTHTHTHIHTHTHNTHTHNTHTQRSKVEMFNDFLREMKSDLIGTRYSAFWDTVVQGEGVRV